MKSITIRLPEDLLKDLERIEQKEKSDRDAAIRRLLEKAVEDWKAERALDELRDGGITFRTAAKKAGLTYMELLDQAKEAGIQLEYTEEDLQKDLAETDG